MAWTPFTRADHDRTSLRYTSDMSDREFAVIAPHLPGQPKRGRKRRICLRSVINGIFYVLQKRLRVGQPAKRLSTKEHGLRLFPTVFSKMAPGRVFTMRSTSTAETWKAASRNRLPPSSTSQSVKTGT